MSIRRMIPMGTTQRNCIVCNYPINARSAELTAHEMECIMGHGDEAFLQNRIKQQADRIEALEKENRELRKRLGENDDDRRS